MKCVRLKTMPNCYAIELRDIFKGSSIRFDFRPYLLDLVLSDVMCFHEQLQSKEN